MPSQYLIFPSKTFVPQKLINSSSGKSFTKARLLISPDSDSIIFLRDFTFPNVSKSVIFLHSSTCISSRLLNKTCNAAMVSNFEALNISSHLRLLKLLTPCKVAIFVFIKLKCSKLLSDGKVDKSLVLGL